MLRSNIELLYTILEKVIKEALTFDDVLVLPMHSDVLPKEVSLQTKLQKY